MRGMIVLAVLAASCGPHAAAPTVKSEDYATARAQFRTRLIRHGPSPQRVEAMTVPDDARELSYVSDGLSLTAWISRSSGGGPHPAVLFLHGGFGFDTTDWDMARPFRDAGYVVMTPILRGEDGQPGDFTYYVDEVDDALAAADVLAHQPGVDAAHVYVAGYSAGGVLALFAAMRSPQFRAAASLSAALDAHLSYAEDVHVFDTGDAAEWRMRSPLAFATSFRCPVHLYWGDRETYHVQPVAELVRRARAAGLDVDSTRVAGTHLTMPAPAIALAIAFFNARR
jgi:dipeptidyl aminopeptidase/acylaminoacyl peptidase